MATPVVGVPADRLASGTSWTPDAVPLPGRHLMLGTWELMLHGLATAQYDIQRGPRGASQVGSVNWGMLMATHPLARGRLQARAMLSLDPATVSERGYPLLLQTGESAHGQPLHDRQHPHDFFVELSALYEQPVTSRLGIALYAAPVGEPALGPVAFLHRPSAMDLAMAPLGHHWQDATHVTFGVVTGGVFTRQWKLEASVFNGREPDENCWNFDSVRLDSYSGRLTMNPGPNWSLSTSYGYLKSPEALTPDESIHRITASVMHGMALGAGGQWASTAVFGANSSSSRPRRSSSLLLESELMFDTMNTVFGRAEYVQKSAAELVLDTPSTGFPSDRTFDVSSVSMGYTRELVQASGMTIGLGVVGTVNRVSAALKTVYGSRTPLGGVVLLRLRPVRSRETGMDSMEHMHHMSSEMTGARGALRPHRE